MTSTTTHVQLVVNREWRGSWGGEQRKEWKAEGKHLMASSPTFAHTSRTAGRPYREMRPRRRWCRTGWWPRGRSGTGSRCSGSTPGRSDPRSGAARRRLSRCRPSLLAFTPGENGPGGPRDWIGRRLHGADGGSRGAKREDPVAQGDFANSYGKRTS